MTEIPTYQGRIVGALARFSRVIVFDQRGVGMSDRMNGTPGLETRMDDVRAVMDAAGSSRAAIVSASIGVPTTLLFAATRFPSGGARYMAERIPGAQLVEGVAPRLAATGRCIRRLAMHGGWWWPGDRVGVPDAGSRSRLPKGGISTIEMIAGAIQARRIAPAIARPRSLGGGHRSGDRLAAARPTRAPTAC